MLCPPFSADFFFSFVPILGFGTTRVSTLVRFFSPDCDFLVVIVSVASLSCNFVRDFSSDLLHRLHLVVVYSDVAAGGHSSTAVQYSATAESLVRRQCGSLPQLGLLTPKKLSGMLCHCVVLDPCVSPFSASVAEESVSVSVLHVARRTMSLSCQFHTLLPFTCAADSCFSLARGRPHDCELCGSVFTPAAVSAAFDLALCLVVNGHASTQTCAQGSTGLHVWWSLLALSHSCFTHVWHHLLGCLSRLFIVNLGSLSALCPSCLRGKD